MTAHLTLTNNDINDSAEYKRWRGMTTNIDQKQTISLEINDSGINIAFSHIVYVQPNQKVDNILGRLTSLIC